MGIRTQTLTTTTPAPAVPKISTRPINAGDRLFRRILMGMSGSVVVILALIAAGKRVGVSSNSHKAINNLLAKVEEVAEAQGVTFSGVKKVTRADCCATIKVRTALPRLICSRW